MGPLAAAIIFGIGSFGIAKMSGASTKKALIAGGIGALGGAGLAHAGALGAAGAGTSATGLSNSALAAKTYGSYNQVAAAQMGAGAAGGGGGFLSGIGSKFAALSPASKIGVGVAGASLVGGLMTPGSEGQMQPGMMGTEEDYQQAYARARANTQGLGERATYTDQGGFVSPNIYAAKEGGLAELRRFSQGGVNYLPSKSDHDEKDYNNYVRAEGYVEDGSGNGDKDTDTMLAQLADGEFVSRADAVLGAGILEGADPTDFKQMRRVGAKYFYKQQDQLKRVYDLVT